MKDKTIIKREISFGKIDYNGIGRKINECIVEFELKCDKDNRMIFTASGSIWNYLKTDIICFGQILEDLLVFFPDNKKLKEIIGVWKVWHLNDTHAGTIEQEKALSEKGYSGDYDKDCEYLRSIGLYEVKLEDATMYKYGTGWIYRKIPADIIKKIKSW